MRQGRLLLLILTSLTLTCGCCVRATTVCGRAPNDVSGEDPATLAAKLEAQGGIVVEQGGRYDVMVASGDQDVAGRVSQLLIDRGVKHSGSFGLGHGAIYVEVGDLERARLLLLREKAQRDLDGLWVFEPKSSK